MKKAKGAPITINWGLIDADWKAGVKSYQMLADEYLATTGSCHQDT